MEFPIGSHLRELPGPVLLTGHTGFKGTWMTFLLEYLEVPVIGYSLKAEKNSLFDRTLRTGILPESIEDIRDKNALERFIELQKPSAIIHMAAQPLVLKSYENPTETFDVNIMGTVNLLDIAFKKDYIKGIIVVTSDKVYRNDNSGKAFIETDPIEGKDPYSASKVGTEAVVAAWQQIAKISGGPKVASVRSGNVIGGGDFAENRIIPDLIRGIIRSESVLIRNPESTRPWQHVLDPLLGYLLALEKLITDKNFSCLNFGPDTQSLMVEEVIEIGKKTFSEILTIVATPSSKQVSLENKKLEINSNLAKDLLDWRPRWNQVEAINKTFCWWKKYLLNGSNPQELCIEDIVSYLDPNSGEISEY
jgi:CDP-glucose 4,6-dehydratase